MLEVTYTWFDKNHHLRFSVLFFAPGGVEPEDLKHTVSSNGTTLTIEYVVPLEFSTAQDLLGVFVWPGTADAIYPPGSSRAAAMTKALNQLCAGRPSNGSRRPMFHQAVPLPFVCAPNLVGHAGGYG